MAPINARGQRGIICGNKITAELLTCPPPWGCMVRPISSTTLQPSRLCTVLPKVWPYKGPKGIL